ncbi:MAG: LURP-one-related/scramblase family protein [Bacillota bacterium]
MRYIVRQKIFSLGDSFTIKDEANNDAFIVRSQLLSFGRKLRIYGLQGDELCFIEQEVFRFLPEYNIYVDGELTAKVKKKFALFKNDFDIESSKGNFYVEGEFWAHEFNIYSDRQLVGRVSKKFFSFTDTYGVEILNEEDGMLTLALAVVIDMVCHDNND